LCHSLFPQVTKKNIADFVTLSSLWRKTEICLK
jgi:hypothetical protein